MRLRARVGYLLGAEHVWPAVVALAKVLLEKKELSGKAARAAYQAAQDV
jgi:hypothetical protein